MNETPVAPTPFIETPAFDSNTFLAHWENEAFLKGKATNPHLLDDTASMNTLAAVVAFFFTGIGAMLIVTNINQIVIMMLGLLLIGGGVGFLALTGTLTSPEKKARKLQGQVIKGQVVESEKIRIEGVYHQQERVRIYYEFIDGTGKQVRRRAEINIAETKWKMAPAPGNPVYLWRDSDGYHTLL